MARKARQRADSGMYHVVLKGNNRLLFVEDSDYRKFLDILTKIAERDFLDIYAYCLLSESAHIAVKEGLCEIGASVKDTISAYALWFNDKYELSGKLFKDRFVSEPIEDDDYLTDCVRYIHQTPQRNNLPIGYTYSSYNNYIKKSGLRSDALMVLFDSSVVSYKMHNEGAVLYTHLTEAKQLKLTDLDLRAKILELLNGVDPTEIESLDPADFKRLVHRFKQIDGASIRQLSRILNLSKNFVEKA